MSELKPCPFCGHKGKIKEYEDGAFRTVCTNSLCPTESFKYWTEKEAADWWNRRAEPVAEGEWIESLLDGEPYKDEWYGTAYHCSLCGSTMLGRSNYCPNCGADMRKEQGNG